MDLDDFVCFAFYKHRHLNDNALTRTPRLLLWLLHIHFHPLALLPEFKHLLRDIRRVQNLVLRIDHSLHADQTAMNSTLPKGTVQGDNLRTLRAFDQGE